MKYLITKIAPILGLLIIFSITIFGQSENPKVRITASEANVLLWPDFNSQVMEQVSTGTELVYMDKINDWYRVYLPPDENGIQRIGYIHQQYVKDLKQTLEDQERQPQYIATPSQRDYGDEKRVKRTDLEMMNSLQEDLRSQALLFLSLIKQMEPTLKETEVTVKLIEKVKVIAPNAQVFDSIVRGAKVIHFPFINETFTLLDESDGYYKIQLPGQRVGWIPRDFVQMFSEQVKKDAVSFTGIDKNEVSGLLQQLMEIFSSISVGKKVADRIAAEYDMTDEALSTFFSNYQKINKYYRYAKKFYEQLMIEENVIYYGSKDSLLKKLQLWGEIMVGMENRETQFAGANTPAEEIDGINHNVSVGTSLDVNQNLDFNFNFNRQKEIMLQEFSTTNFDGSVSYSGGNNFNAIFRGGYNAYRSPNNSNAEFNNLSLGSDVDYLFSENTGFILNYNMNSYSYINDEFNNHNIHSINGGIKSKPSSGSTLDLNVLFELESGDADTHQFTHIKPYLLYYKRFKTRFMRARLEYDNFSFEEIKLSNYQKYLGELTFGSSQSNLSLGAFYKAFPENTASSYFRLMFRTSSNSKDYRKRFNFSIYSNFFTKNSSISFTDFRFETGNAGKLLDSSLNILFKFWHSPGDEDKGETIKPHILDVYAKLGLNLKYLRLGPVIGLHGNIATSGDGDFIERDGNLLRIGGYAELDLPVTERLRIMGNGTFEYGNVYTNNYTGFDDNTGDIEIDGIYLRHPVTYQANISANYELNSRLTLFGRGGLYKIKTDFDFIPGFYAIDSNARFFIMGGIRFNLN